jgi:hypothetical protein
MLHPDNPYSLAPVENPRLLRTRRAEIRLALDTVAPTDGSSGHALVCGPRRTGRTSTLKEVSRRAQSERGCLVVNLRLFEEDLTTTGLMRTFLSAAIEQLAALHDTEPDWYRTWCNRVLLRDQSPMGIGDLFVSGLAFAADPRATLDPAVFDRDLRTLRRLAREAGRSRTLLVIDNADALLEDPALVERLFDAIDGNAEWSVLAASRFSGVNNLAEAVSPVLRRCRLVPLRPFWSPGMIRACLVGPLEPGEADRLMPSEKELGLLVDLLQLSMGNPFDIALIAGHLWDACEVGEQEFYELTPRVIERVLPSLTMHTGARDGLHDGAEAARRLAPDRLESALQLVALSELTVPQIAVARALKLPWDETGEVGRRLQDCDLAKEHQRVIGELEQLEVEGVIELAEDHESFTVRGGRFAALTLKYQTRSLVGSTLVDLPFGMPYLATVGQPVAREWLSTARERIDATASLAWQSIHNPTGTATGTRLHAALSLQRFDNVDLEMFPTDEDAYDQLIDCLIRREEMAIALVDLTLAAEGDDLAWIELWEVPPPTTTHDVNQGLSDSLDEWQPRIEKAGITWRSSQAVVLHGDLARRSLIQLAPSATGAAVGKLFGGWHEGNDADGLDRALALADMAVDALREQRVPDWERGWELSEMLSRRGFLRSLYEDRLADAAADLRQAGERGPADGWVTDWNLGNIAIRAGEHASATQYMAKVEQALQADTEKALQVDPETAVAAFYVPGRQAVDSVLLLSPKSLDVLLPLQRAITDSMFAHGLPESLSAALDACREYEHDSVAVIVGWVQEAIEQGALAPKATATDPGPVASPVGASG